MTLSRRRILGASAAAALLPGIVRSSASGANQVLAWNEIGFDVTMEGGQNPIHVSRSMAMMHLAIHDALNALDRRFEPYLYHGASATRPARDGAVLETVADAPRDLNGRDVLDVMADAAIATAARDVLVQAVPQWGNADQRAKALRMTELAFGTAIANLPEGAARQHGIATGAAAARAIIAARQADGAQAQSPYRPTNEPGRWRPHPNPVPANPPIPNPVLAAGNWPPLLPQWATLSPFTMVTPSQFRLPGPPALASAAYARDFDEVKRLGGKASTARTAEQTEIAKYWYEGSPQGWSRIARVVLGARGMDRWDSARLLALVNAVIADGYIAGADTRYLVDLWRPVTAIREADKDGNEATVPDPVWESFLNTPPLPDYPSTHSVAGGAAAAVLARFFGTDQVAFTMTSGPPFAGITRSFAGFAQAAQENADSRVYAGVHFRSACQDGILQGRQIGRRAFTHYLQPWRE